MTVTDVGLTATSAVNTALPMLVSFLVGTCLADTVTAVKTTTRKIRNHLTTTITTEPERETCS